MPEIGEGQATASIPEEKEDVKTIKIRYSIFFDGTLNNRTNIDSRLVSASDDKLTEEEKKTAAELKAKRSEADLKKAKGIYKKHTGVGSFENGYTNIVKLERYIETEPANDYQLVLASYIEGPGTRDEKSDKMLGYAIGVGVSGVKKKVKNGLKEVFNTVKFHHPKRSEKIEKLTIDVFGFSRGAAAARSFIHEALFTGNKIADQLKNDGYKVGKVEVCFAGLYDTVSSHGIKFSNDTAKLNLDAVAHAKHVVHLVAADEHRENFSLTTIESAGGNAIQIYLPGVHSDVGGSYRDGATENQDIFWTMGPGGEDRAKQEIKKLVTDGWYKENELEVIRSRIDRAGGKVSIQETIIRAARNSISNQYSRIPLHSMAKFAREKEISILSRLENVESINSDLSSVKQKIDTYIDEHKSPGAFSSKTLHWVQNKDNWLTELRHSYFHFSARLETGNGPRYINGERARQDYYG